MGILLQMLRDAPFDIRRGARELGSRQFIYLSLLRQFFPSPPWWDKLLFFDHHLDKRSEACTGMGHDKHKNPGWGMTKKKCKPWLVQQFLFSSKNSLARPLIWNGASLNVYQHDQMDHKPFPFYVFECTNHFALDCIGWKALSRSLGCPFVRN